MDIGLLFVVIFSFIVGLILVWVVHAVISEGVRDESLYPFGVCDTSVVEECLEE